MPGEDQESRAADAEALAPGARVPGAKWRSNRPNTIRRAVKQLLDKNFDPRLLRKA